MRSGPAAATLILRLHGEPRPLLEGQSLTFALLAGHPAGDPDRARRVHIMASP